MRDERECERGEREGRERENQRCRERPKVSEKDMKAMHKRNFIAGYVELVIQFGPNLR